MTTSDKLSFLKQKFLSTVKIRDAKTGYVVVEEFNIQIDPDILEFASRCWAEHYHHDTHIDAIVGLPDAGARLVSILGSLLRVPHILPSKRTTVVPGAWRDVVSFRNTSFTTGKEDVLSHIGFVTAGMRILVVDDVVAHGSTAVAGIKALQAAGAEVVGLAVLFDKQWQGGKKEIEEETGVEVFSLVTIEAIKDDGSIVLAS